VSALFNSLRYHLGFSLLATAASILVATEAQPEFEVQPLDLQRGDGSSSTRTGCSRTAGRRATRSHGRTFAR
jgi:hypothetical protein